MTHYMLSTIDNPYNPFSDYEKWNNYDVSKGYHTMNYLMRIARVSPDLEEQEYENEIQDAVDTICRLHPMGMYIKLSETTSP